MRSCSPRLTFRARCCHKFVRAAKSMAKQLSAPSPAFPSREYLAISRQRWWARRALARAKARLAHQRCLLIAKYSREGNAGDGAESCFAIDFAARTNLWQHRARNVKRGEQLRIPIQGFQIQKLGTAGVCHIGYMHSAWRSARQIPQEKGVDIPEKQLAPGGLLPGARN